MRKCIRERKGIRLFGYESDRNIDLYRQRYRYQYRYRFDEVTHIHHLLLIDTYCHMNALESIAFSMGWM